ncbi:hypothetical protein K4K59_002993 [Colletotrichum sp. SAR11_240]|nr:hypothetical protein K4K59_002993 [Colletotrichum sp. SAR11_240]
MSYDVPHEDQNSLCEQGHHGYASHDEGEVAMSMDFQMADHTEVADAQNVFVKHEDQQAYHSDDTAPQDDRMIEGTSTNDEQTHLADHSNKSVDPAVEAKIIDDFHRLAAEILVASKENKGPPVQDIYDSLQQHFDYIEWQAEYIVGDVRRRLMDTVLVMFDPDSLESQQYIDTKSRERAFKLWQFWAFSNLSQVDETTFAAMDDSDRKYCMVFNKESITMPGSMPIFHPQACYKAPDADMSMGDYDSMANHETVVSEDTSQYLGQAEDGVYHSHYSQGPMDGQNFYHMSLHAYPEVPTCVHDPLNTEDHMEDHMEEDHMEDHTNVQTAIDPIAPVAMQAKPSKHRTAKPRRKTAKAAAVKSDSNSNPPDGLYVPDKHHEMFGENGPFRGIAYVLKAGKRSWVAHPDYASVKSRVFGDNHIPVGKWWPAQMVACVNGAHSNWFGGITGDKDQGAHSIVKSGGTYDSLNEDQGNTIFYSGSGAHKCTDNKPKNSDGTEMLYKSLKSNLPVRVLRAAAKKGKNGLYSPSVGIRYDGLYDVVRRTKAFNDNGGAY